MSSEPFEPRPDPSQRADEYGRVEQPRRNDGDHRSLFWPIVLIGAGAIWLLSNLGIVDPGALRILLRLWPLVLIIIGLDLLFGRRWPALGALIGLGTVGLIIAILILGPRLGVDAGGPVSILGLPIHTSITDADIRTERFSEPLDDARSANVSLELYVGRTTIHALEDSDQLIDAQLAHIGEIDFRATGESDKTIHLSQREEISFGPLLGNGMRLNWDIGLSPEVPLDLAIDVRSGPAEADLRALQLQSLDIDGGSGPLDVTLPEGATDYRARIDAGSGPIDVSAPEGSVLSDLEIAGGSGPLTIAIEAGARLQASVDAGSGPVTVDVPEQAGVRVRVIDDGSGPFRVPSNYVRTEGGADDTGTWESPNYNSAAQRIDLEFALGSGPVAVQ